MMQSCTLLFVVAALMLMPRGLAVPGQEYVPLSEMNLCDKRTGFEPNGEYLATPGDTVRVTVNWTITDPTSQKRCLLKFSTCEQCRLKVQAAESFYYPCSRYLNKADPFQGQCIPGCTYIHLYDRDYISQTAHSYTSVSTTGIHSVLNFRTESSNVYVVGCANMTEVGHVLIKLIVTSEEKTRTFKSSASDVGKGFSFSSPFFPEEYVLNSEVFKFVFEAATQNEFITVSFDDWQLAPHSFIRFDSANIKGEIYGNNYRPWIISDSHNLVMTFNTGPHKIPGTIRAYKGFRAVYTFYNKDRDDVPFVHTNCGPQLRDDVSNTIEFNPAANGLDYYDCVWVIKKNTAYERVMVKVLRYQTTDTTYRRNRPNRLQVKRGITSLGGILEEAEARSTPADLTYNAHVDDEGFYVRLKGHYYGRRDFKLVYTSFNIDNCINLFKCANRRCISKGLTCDGIDHCGDNSDETETGGCRDSVPTHGSGNSSRISVGIIIPLVVSAFLIVVICLLILFIRRCRRLSQQARRAERRQHRINNISGSVGQQRRRHRRRGERRDRGGPDLPPSYEDVLNNTPIGYLNLGYQDVSYHPTNPIQPPSYEEAMSPTEQNAPLSFQSGRSHNLSSDSSSPETINRSQANLSTSYSSDDTHPSRNHRRRHRRRPASDSSSDSSAENENPDSFGVQGRSCEVSESNNQGNKNEQTEVAPTNSRHSIAKPEDALIKPTVSATDELSSPKDLTPKRSVNRQKIENPAVGITTVQLPSESSPVSEPERRSESSNQHLIGRLEDSPLVLAPSSLGLASSDPEQRGSCAGHGETQALDISDAASPQPSVDPVENRSARENRYNRASPAKHVPSHIQKAKGPSRGLMKHLSRSMNDVGRDSDESREHSDLGKRQYSRSVHNVAGAQRWDLQPAPLQRGLVHHQSQPLLFVEGSSELGGGAQRRDNRQGNGRFASLDSQGDGQMGMSKFYPNHKRSVLPNPGIEERRSSNIRVDPSQSRRHHQAPSSPRERNLSPTRRDIPPGDRSRSDHEARTRPDPKYRPDLHHTQIIQSNPEYGSDQMRSNHPHQSRSPPRYRSRSGQEVGPPERHQPPSYSQSLDRQSKNPPQSIIQGRPSLKTLSLDRHSTDPQHREHGRPHPNALSPHRPRDRPYPNAVNHDRQKNPIQEPREHRKPSPNAVNTDGHDPNPERREQGMSNPNAFSPHRQREQDRPYSNAANHDRQNPNLDMRQRGRPDSRPLSPNRQNMEFRDRGRPGTKALSPDRQNKNPEHREQGRLLSNATSLDRHGQNPGREPARGGENNVRRSPPGQSSQPRPPSYSDQAARPNSRREHEPPSPVRNMPQNSRDFPSYRQPEAMGFQKQAQAQHSSPPLNPRRAEGPDHARRDVRPTETRETSGIHIKPSETSRAQSSDTRGAPSSDLKFVTGCSDQGRPSRSSPHEHPSLAQGDVNPDTHPLEKPPQHPPKPARTSHPKKESTGMGDQLETGKPEVTEGVQSSSRKEPEGSRNYPALALRLSGQMEFEDDDIYV